MFDDVAVADGGGVGAAPVTHDIADAVTSVPGGVAAVTVTAVTGVAGQDVMMVVLVGVVMMVIGPLVVQQSYQELK